jgi:hypothetical protein
MNVQHRLSLPPDKLSDKELMARIAALEKAERMQ